jgi:hypothetical protein
MGIEALKEYCDVLVGDIDRLRSENERLRAAIKRYGRHLPDCDHFRETIHPDVNCDCGFKFAALRGEEKKE